MVKLKKKIWSCDFVSKYGKLVSKYVGPMEHLGSMVWNRGESTIATIKSMPRSFEKKKQQKKKIFLEVSYFWRYLDSKNPNPKDQTFSKKQIQLELNLKAS